MKEFFWHNVLQYSLIGDALQVIQAKIKNNIIIITFKKSNQKEKKCAKEKLKDTLSVEVKQKANPKAGH